MFPIGGRMLITRFVLLFASIGIIGIAAYFEFNNVKCFTYDKEFMEYEYCFLKAINRTYKYLSLKTKLYKVPINSCKIIFKVVNRDNCNIFQHLNGSINVCKFLKDGLNPFARLLFQTFKPYSNLNHTCPYDHDIIVEKLPIQYVNSIIANIIPDGRYLLNLTFYCNNIPRTDVAVYFTKF